MKHLALLSLVVLAACGGGGSSPTPTGPVGVSPTVAPSNAPSSAPTTKPTTAPTVAPTGAPTVAPLNVLQVAPIASTPTTLSKARRPQSGVTSSLPLLVESAGTSGIWAGDFVVWVTNALTGMDTQETSGTITATNGLVVNSPGFGALACPAASTLWCATHPLGWDFGTSSVVSAKPVGKQTLTVAFGDGTTGSIYDYVYNGWSLNCGQGWAYSNGVPVPTTTAATSDVFADCSAGNIVFPKGAILASNPVQDQYGRYETVFPTITAAIYLSSAVVNVPMASVAYGQVYGISTQDGGMAKVYLEGASATTNVALNGMSLHANTDGTYAY